MEIDGIQTLSKAEIAALQLALPSMSPQEKMELMQDLEVREARTRLAFARSSVLGFANAEGVYPGFKTGPHHKIISKLLTEVINGTKKRVILNVAPRHGKSEISSYLFPAYFLGKYPEKKIIMATHTAKLSEDFGRKVRNLVDSEEYKTIFPGTKVADDQSAAGKWSTSAGGQYYAAGVGGALAGRGADLFVVDDPHSEQDVKANSRAAFDNAWTWFQTGPLQRLMPGGAIIVIMCMVGDTDVLLADGTTRKLRDIRRGDKVATYENGGITTSVVNNWRSNGVDSIYTVRTRSGTTLQANERHPFLVEHKGVRKWVRLKDLQTGFLLVSSKSAQTRLELPQCEVCVARVRSEQEKKFLGHAPQHNTSSVRLTGVRGSLDQLRNKVDAGLVKQVRRTIEKTLMRLSLRSDTTVNGKIKAACLTGAQRLLNLGGIAISAIERSIPLKRQHQKKNVLHELNTGMALPKLPILRLWRSKKIFALFVDTLQVVLILGRTGTETCVSTTATTREKCEACCATIAISQSDTVKHPPLCAAPLSTYNVTTDEILEIVPAGEAEVFDVEVDRTENFIANGVVSHNTRWSTLDLTGRLIDYQSKNPDAEPWEVIELPAILDEGMDDEKSLWPEQWPLASLKAVKASLDPQYWNAQYMQNPTSNNAAIISRKLWQIWPDEKPPECSFLIQSWDTAFESTNTADYSACTTWGVWFNAEDNNIAHVILLDAFKARMQFPELKATALKHYKEWSPDCLMVEKKASGAPLIQELRAMGLPVQEFSPSRGNDKVTRLNSISDLFASSRVWAPDTRWARELMDEVASFPNGANDDFVDATSMALMRLRQGGFVGTKNDEPEEPKMFRRRTNSYY